MQRRFHDDFVPRKLGNLIEGDYPYLYRPCFLPLSGFECMTSESRCSLTSGESKANRSASEIMEPVLAVYTAHEP